MSTLVNNEETFDVIIVGAGPTGLTLACDLVRRGMKVRILEKSETAFNGSRGKGIQPRTQEIFDNLGAVKSLLRAGDTYPPMKVHFGFLGIKWRMMKIRKETSDVPYPNILLIPQWRTEEVLRNRLQELGQQVEWGVEVTSIAQDSEGVTVKAQIEGATQTLRARYLVGSDGGRSFVRKAVGINFIGSTSQEGRMIVGDVHVDGLAPDAWHVWPSLKGGLIGLCPLPHSDLFQVMIKLDPSDTEPELTEKGIQDRWLATTGNQKIRLHSPNWLSVFRPNVRLVEKYRVGRILLAGDAAHVHTPAGAQGLNTGIQDAYNLGWKLGAVLKGAPIALLDTYQEERMPIAADVLELSSELFKTVNRASIPKLTRGDKERQLQLNYRGSSLAVDAGTTQGQKLRAGDRAPDAICSKGVAEPTRLFDVFRGGHFTLLAFGSKAIDETQGTRFRDADVLRTVAVLPSHISHGLDMLVDGAAQARQAYGVGKEENVTFLVRPDGYIGHVATSNWKGSIERYLSFVLGASAKP